MDKRYCRYVDPKVEVETDVCDDLNPVIWEMLTRKRAEVRKNVNTNISNTKLVNFQVFTVAFLYWKASCSKAQHRLRAQAPKS